MWKILCLNWGRRAFYVHCGRQISMASTFLKSHYDVLGVTPKATQSDIKAAYYRLSMVHHPDKNKGADSSATFREITAAYEVLGNYKLRKLYDRGVMHTAGVDQPSHVHENEEGRFYQSRASRHTAPPPTGKTPIYDFDEWARQHYGNSFAKRAQAKARWQRSLKYKEAAIWNMQTDLTMIMFITIAASLVLFTYIFSNRYDVDHTRDKTPEKKVNSLES